MVVALDESWITPTLKNADWTFSPGASAGNWKKYSDVMPPGALAPVPLKLLWKPTREPVLKFSLAI